jgi:multidrug efflux pump subunit AcrA (membrane-fusion protein)
MTNAIEKTDPGSSWADEFQFDESDLGDPPGRRRWWRWLTVPLVAVVIAAAAFWIAKPFGTEAASLVTATATTGTIVSSVSISGSIASSSINELSFDTSGTVTAVNVAVGDSVTEGQVLATIDDSSLQVQLQTAQANVDAAQARLDDDLAAPTADTIAAAKDSVDQATLQLSTARTSLSDTKAQNKQNIADATAALNAAKATLTADKASLPADDPQLAKDEAAVTSATSALANTKLRATQSQHQAEAQVSSATLALTTAKHNYTTRTAPTTDAQIAADRASLAQAQQALANLQATGATITSPINGTVTAVNVEVGQQVSGSSGSSGASAASSTTGQIEVMDLANLQIAGEASETDVSKLKMDQPATITATALGSETVVGKVCQLSVVGTQISGVTSFGVTVCISGTNPALLVGMSATAAVVTNRADNAVLVPSLAVKTVGGQQVVSVLGADGKTETNVPVTVGISNGSETQIVSGLGAGATVVESLQTTTPTRGGGFGGGGRIFQGGGGFGG